MYKQSIHLGKQLWSLFTSVILGAHLNLSTMSDDEFNVRELSKGFLPGVMRAQEQPLLALEDDTFTGGSTSGVARPWL